MSVIHELHVGSRRKRNVGSRRNRNVGSRRNLLICVIGCILILSKNSVFQDALDLDHWSKNIDIRNQPVPNEQTLPPVSIHQTHLHDFYNMEYDSLDPQSITHVYHLGHIRPYGRSNNRILAILHAVDILFDEHGDHRKNRAVVAVSKWAFDILNQLFHDGDNATEFALELENLRPALLVHEDRLEALGLTESHNITQVWLRSQYAYEYIMKNRGKFTPQSIQEHRNLVWGQLLRRGVAKRNLLLYHSVRDFINKRTSIFGDEKRIHSEYLTIHSRWLEGECERRVGDALPHDECWMTPSYIKQILGGKVDRPIVFIGDGQNEDVLKNLRRDAEIGPAIIIPEETVPEGVEVLKSTQPWSDMMIAIMGDAFIGTRVSTFATMVGVSRVVLGADPTSNFIYTSGYDPTNDTQKNIEVCEECLFLCDGNKSHLCGHEPIYS